MFNPSNHGRQSTVQTVASSLSSGGTAQSQLRHLRESSSSGGTSSVVSSASSGSALTEGNLSSLLRSQPAYKSRSKSIKTEASGLSHVTPSLGKSSGFGTSASVSKGFNTTYAPNGGILVVPPNTRIKANYAPVEFYPFGSGDKRV